MRRLLHLRVLAGVVGVFIVAAVVCFGPAWLQQYQAGTYVRSHAIVTRQPIGVFEWRNVVSASPEKYAQTLASLHKLGYGTIFVEYNQSEALSDPANYGKALDAFGSLANHNGLRLAIIAGDPSWANARNASDVASVLAFVRNYNAMFAQKIASVQFDIEPYETDANAITTAKELASLAQSVAGDPSNNGVAVGFTVPFWIAQDPSDTKSLLRAVSRMPGSFVTVMDYRTATAGADGSVALAAPFFALAEGLPLKLYLAEDTSKTTPAKTTFFGKSSFDLRLAQYKIDQAERTQSTYAGQMVNDAQSLAQLK